MKRLILSSFFIANLLSCPQFAFGQGGEIQVPVGFNEAGNTPPIWVSISGFSGEAAEVIRFDLYVQGFNFTNAQSAQYLISGSSNGNLQGRVADRFNNRTLVDKGYTGASPRRQAHAFVDAFMEALGRKGIGKTMIAYKVESGESSEIYVADFDGDRAQPITHDHSIVAAPAWVPGRAPSDALYYTSYRLGNPDIFYQDLSGNRSLFAHYPGLNTSAAPSPGGGKVAMILSKSGSPDVYVCNANGSGLLQLTKTPEDESSPCWSPDGQWICYATKIRERRVLCKVPAGGGPRQVVGTPGAHNPSEPDWSPDGKWIAFTSQWSDFQIWVVPAAGGPATKLVEGEDPSWAPNGRTVIYTRRTANRPVLSLLDVPTKQFKDIPRVSGSQPNWGR